ncbi:helix-turn-helix domain-containing protein [Rhizosphaericola mali]|uniref:Helix-turn-helix domain-containing protein n=1 Tax=Rhizosphaericola mali TaxID=2545455 RepID=A0A5P2G3W1_9BACT|nr:helix-turn-helix domain-containing protein [Rhizosphaericola mali]QES88819.1 helix-turn-helix domain-containing protein [Rhizosphaericola mali]
MNIKELRKERNLSQQDLADATGISKAKIEKWEVGKGAPKVEDYITLQNFFGINNSDSNEADLELNKDELNKESQLASIASNIKMDYMVALLAEIQEKLDPTKAASVIVSKVQKLSQLDFENKLNRMKA